VAFSFVDDVNLVSNDDETVGDFLIERDGGRVVHQKSLGDRSIETPVSSILKIAAESRNHAGQDWGKLLVFTDPGGNRKTYHLRTADLALRASFVVGELIHEGLRLENRTLLVKYLHELRSNNHVLSASQPGWVGHNFCLPDRSFGDDVLYSSSTKHHNFRQAGTVADWKKNVAALCTRNSRLLFGASVGFAAPLLRLVGIEGGGFHISGVSSTGKSTTLQIASSIFGSAEEGNRERYLVNWDTTKGSLEMTAESLNDCLFACDELGLVDGKILGQTLYMLANGSGKGRMNEQKRAWRTLLLTSGEVSIAEHMASAGVETKQGMEVRLLEIAADAGHGPNGKPSLFEDVHRFSSHAEFANHIKKVTSQFYGSILYAWIDTLVEHREEITVEARAIIERFKTEVIKGTVATTGPRAALRFGAVAAAGEIATRCGLTGWKQGEAYEACVTCFASWREHSKTFDSTAKAVERMRQFILTHEKTFVDWKSTNNPTVGYIKNGHFLIIIDVFKEIVCAGVDYQEVAKHLEKAGYLRVGGPNRQQRQDRVQGKWDRFYSIKASIKDAE